MIRNLVLFLSVVLALAACAAPSPQMGPDGKPLPRV
jgi:hypothetical protein